MTRKQRALTRLTPNAHVQQNGSNHRAEKNVVQISKCCVPVRMTSGLMHFASYKENNESTYRNSSRVLSKRVYDKCVQNTLRMHI